MGNVKASRWIDVEQFLLKNYGPGGIEKVVAALSPSDRALFQQKIIPIMWLNYDAFLRYLFTADKVLGKGDHSLVTASAQYTARNHFSGMYRFFISLASPHFVIKRASQVWRQYFDVGQMEVLDVQDKSSTVKLTGFPDIPLHHDLSHTPFIEEILRMSSAKNPRGKHPKCMARKDDACVWEFTWE